jgi:hypothetical protein
MGGDHGGGDSGMVQSSQWKYICPDFLHVAGRCVMKGKNAANPLETLKI